MPTRRAEAVWEGDLRSGKGRMKLGSGAFEGQYNFSSRFEEGVGTNPEELIGAAHAGCFSMALSGRLTANETPPDKIETSAAVTIDRVDGAMKITRIDLVTKAKVPGVDDAKFQELAADAKANCPVSQALAGAEITLDATLEK